VIKYSLAAGKGTAQKASIPATFPRLSTSHDTDDRRKVCEKQTYNGNVSTLKQ